MATSGFQVNGADVASTFIEKSYLIDRYPELADTFKQAGLWLWGRNVYGQLGDPTLTDRSSPIQTLAGGTNWQQVAVSGYHTTAIKTDGTLWSFGYNGGVLGDNSITDKVSPVQTIAGGTNWKQVSCGGIHVVAVKTDGTLWTWGDNSNGQLGTNNTTARSSPVQTISGTSNWKYVSAGDEFTTAIKTDGTLWLWGRNLYYGQLGDNSTVSKSSPVQITGGGTTWRISSAGVHHAGAIKSDGTLWLWGRNNYGDLGDNTITHRSSPVQTISGGTNWKLVSCGGDHTAAIKTDGTLWMWGSNAQGRMGDNTEINKSSPVQTISGGTNWKSVFLGRYNTSALKTDGTLWRWGNNIFGTLGDNTNTDKSSPVQTIAGGTNWKSITAGFRHAAAIRDDSADPI